jgi:DNA-binding PadR family transcriptional regulator
LSDKSSEIIMAALRRASVEPAGMPLHGSRGQSLFAASASGKNAAQLCKSEGYLQIVKTEHRGRRVREIYAITEKGLAYLLHQVSPKQVLEDLVRALHSQQTQIGELLATARHWQANSDSCKTLVQKVLHQAGQCAWGTSNVNGKAEKKTSQDSSATDETQIEHGKESVFDPCFIGGSALGEAILSQLHQWRESGAAGDCPLPELFRRTGQNLSIGQFHDQLRALQEQQQIYLHPWSGPLHEIPEPALAFLAGHGIVYYASIR